MNIHHKISKAIKVSRWGNSLAIRLPAALVRQLGLKEGDAIEVRARNNGEGENSIDIKKAKTLEEHIDDLKHINAKIPEGYKFDREEANAR